MKLLVDIPEDFYDKIKRNIRPTTEEIQSLIDPIYNGIPSIDKDTPVGEWIDTGDKEECWAEWYICPICGKGSYWNHYCPWCGARLE